MYAGLVMFSLGLGFSTDSFTRIALACLLGYVLVSFVLWEVGRNCGGSCVGGGDGSCGGGDCGTICYLFSDVRSHLDTTITLSTAYQGLRLIFFVWYI